MKKLTLTVMLGTLLAGCSSTDDAPQNNAVAETDKGGFSLPYESFTLDNGLTVLLHQDKSDPIVALTTVVHVGSSRERAGRTGFAHFFEHMAFNDSENVPKGANRKMIPELGGSRNGGTWSDGTIYYEVVPVDAFEKLLWIDSDRFGYMINTVNEPTLEREKQVVKNEKRERVDNRPYGHTGAVVRAALYPEGHPYSWTTIGKLEDLQNATLDDVRDFYKDFYVPSNATLAIAGDIDIEKTKRMVKEWFGEIKAGKPVPDMAPMPVSLDEDVKLYHLDNFAKLPQLQLTFPTVEQYHPDSYALNVLGQILAQGKRAPLFTTIVKDLKLSSMVRAYQSSSELAGTFTMTVRANADVKLDDAHNAVDAALLRFEQEGFHDKDLERIKAGLETEFYQDMSSVLGKTRMLATYNEFANDPNYAAKDIAAIMAVSREDVMRVYNKYIKNKPAVITSFVPKDKGDLVLSGSAKAHIDEEKIVAGAEKQFTESDDMQFAKTPSVKDRSEPPLGEQPPVVLPEVWQRTTANGIEVYGMEHNELPLVSFSLRMDGGQWLDDKAKIGTADLLAQLMSEGTASMSPAEMEDAIGMIGAEIEVRAGREGIDITGSVLSRNFDKAMELVSEIVLAPRFEEVIFKRLKARQMARIKQSEGRASSIAGQVFARQIFGPDHLGGQPMGGSAETVKAIELADLKAWYGKNMAPNHAKFHIAGDIKPAQVEKALATLVKRWERKTVTFPALEAPKAV